MLLNLSEMCSLPLGAANVIVLFGVDGRGRDKWWADRFASAEVAVGDVFSGREWEWAVFEELICAWIMAQRATHPLASGWVGLLNSFYDTVSRTAERR
jgi:hypothetical protein